MFGEARKKRSCVYRLSTRKFCVSCKKRVTVGGRENKAFPGHEARGLQHGAARKRRKQDLIRTKSGPLLVKGRTRRFPGHDARGAQNGRAQRRTKYRVQ